MASRRFDYVAFDKQAHQTQSATRKVIELLEHDLEALHEIPRGEGEPSARSLALLKLEECYNWVGKAIRDDQVVRNGDGPIEPHETVEDTHSGATLT